MTVTIVVFFWLYSRMMSSISLRSCGERGKRINTFRSDLVTQGLRCQLRYRNVDKDESYETSDEKGCQDPGISLFVLLVFDQHLFHSLMLSETLPSMSLFSSFP